MITTMCPSVGIDPETVTGLDAEALAALERSKRAFATPGVARCGERSIAVRKSLHDAAARLK